MKLPTANRPTSEILMERSRQTLAGGESSTMRVLPYHPPFVVDRGQGCRVWDVDDNAYVDLNMAYGPLLFGHRPAFVVDAVTQQLRDKGSQLGFPHVLNFQVAEKIVKLIASVEQLRFANSGTEAIASAVRLARAVTGRKKLVLFEGHYHGWSDAVFHEYHASLDRLGDGRGQPALPGTLGMNGAPHDVLVVDWNDLEALDHCFAQHRGAIAAVIMEPVMGNAGVVAPNDGYLEGVRALTSEQGALLVFDEVITGLRLAGGGAQAHYGVSADITIISKALGGGFPVAAFGASKDLMARVARGEVFHGGVYSGNALVLAAADAVLTKVISEGRSLYDPLHAVGNALAEGLRDILGRLNVSHVVQNVGPMVAFYLTHTETGRLESYRQVRSLCDPKRYIALQHALLDRGVYIHPNCFEPLYLSTAHDPATIDGVLERFEDAARASLQC